jgi:hypothetical protein
MRGDFFEGFVLNCPNAGSYLPCVLGFVGTNLVKKCANVFWDVAHTASFFD